MKILFAYFDFSANNNKQISAHLREECALNFSTDYNYAVQKTSSGHYSVSREKKPDKECLPKDFWGQRIYNITAIVGDNGSGKSTILHSIIKAVVRGLDPGVPFLMILQPLDSDQPYFYCSSQLGFTWDGVEPFRMQNEYPAQLLTAKCMLLDNTLSLSSYSLSLDYNESAHSFAPKDDPYLEWQKQLFNKSLYASIQFSNNISLSRIRASQNPVSDMMSIHFTYESFQELRFLFDRSHLEILNELEKQGYPVPKTEHLSVSIMHPDRMITSYFGSDSALHTAFSSLSRVFFDHGFAGQVIIDSTVNAICRLDDLLSSDNDEDQSGQLETPEFINELSNVLSNRPIKTTKEIAKVADDFIKHLIEKYKSYKKYLEPIQNFVQYVNDEKTLPKVFREKTSGTSHNEPECLIDVKEVASDEIKQKCMISFIENYRKACDPRYFLVFVSGMSSGEKNLLRMLTQFRYILKGPTAESKGIYLENAFNGREKYCDTFFLFLDEIDLTYHVEWQRLIISMLTTILPQMFREEYFPEGDKNAKKGTDNPGCKDIQVILATHSPLILGDFPKASVIYLQDPQNNKIALQNSTFGENLYTILKNGFFMNDTIGEFAKRKINDIAIWCFTVRDYYAKKRVNSKNTDNEKEEQWKNELKEKYEIMQLLPPGILQNKLKLELEDCARMLDDTWQRYEQDDPVILKKQIEELKAQLSLERNGSKRN